ncbi:MAG: cysteine desulfurase family protein [Cyanobacteriota bacterium]|jgi:cysteine desulfurase|nr:cysteine desulfurase family protein [Cyanobacteriota bacterium]
MSVSDVPINSSVPGIPAERRLADRGLYLDACATTPPAEAVIEAMAEAQRDAWANPSSLHGHGLAAAESLERSRLSIAASLGCGAEQVMLCSGGTEAIHNALHGIAAEEAPARLLISDVEHPATVAAAEQLRRRGWTVMRVPVDHRGLVRLDALEALLTPPTRMVSLIWGQSEVGALQDIETIGRLCRGAGILLHVDGVQVAGHRQLRLADLPIDLFSCASHKLQGPRGIGALVVRSDLRLTPFIGGGGQERGRRGGTESVVLAAGFARALELGRERLEAHGGNDPIRQERDRLLERLLAMEGVRLSGPEPGPQRLPHHISLLLSTPSGRPLSGRRLVQTMGLQGYAVSSGSACSSGRGADPYGLAPSPILLAMGYGEKEAATGLRLSLGPWLSAEDLEPVPAALERARLRVMAGEPVG